MRILVWTLAYILGGLLCAQVSADDAFLRIQHRANGTDCLQVAVKTYQTAGAQVKLVGVSHIGTQAYYETLQTEVLNPANVVLFEGVDGDRPAFREATEEKSPERSTLQANLARALGLVFQLHHIDYEQPNFVNSDVSSTQLMALFDGEEMPESSKEAQADMEDLLAGMGEATLSGQAAAVALNFLEMRPGWSRGMRWGMVRMLGSVTGNVAEYPGLPEHLRTLMQVLIQKRNENVMADVRDQVAKLPVGGTVVIFYGAAHMHDFETRLAEEMGAKLTDTEWRTAFCGNLQTSGLNVVEKKMLAWFVNQQVRTLKIIATPSVPENGEEKTPNPMPSTR